MKNLKKVIIILVILLIAIIGIILYITKKDKSDNGIIYVKESKENEKLRIEYTSDINNQLSLLSSRMDYLSLKKCIEKYKDATDLLMDKESSIEDKTLNMDKIYSILDKEYIESNNISKTNLADHLKNDYAKSKFYIDYIYQKEISMQFSIYLIYGRQRELSNNTISEYGYIIKVNKENSSFSIIPYDYMKANGLENIDENNNVNITNIEKENIESNEYNKYEMVLTNDENISIEHFEHYKNNLLYDKEKLYESLNDEYKQKRFKNYDNFLAYVNQNMETLSNAAIIKYKRTTVDDKIQYNCIDQDDNCYIFKEKEIMKYELILDTYTIDLPEFLEKYNSTNENGKVALNIQKFIQAINAKDYEYAYNCLDEEFKKNNYPTLDSFANYIKANLYNKIKLELKNYINEGEINIYNITLKDAENEENLAIDMQVIMKLQEGTGFVMSFSKK